MRFHGVLSTTLAAAVSLAISAGAAAQTTNAAEAAAQADAQVREQARLNAITDRYLTAVPVEMASKVDTKNAAIGQEVSARTTAEARLADGTVLPKGTKLVGYVIQVKPGGQELGSALLTLTFDHAEVKAGQSINVRAVIRAVAPNAAAAAIREIPEQPAMSMPAGPIMGPSGRGSNRGGVAGGMPGTVPTMGGGVGGTGGIGGYPGSNNPSVGMPGGTGNNGGGMGGTPGSTLPSADSGPTIGGRAPSINTSGPAAVIADRRVSDAGESLSGAPKATGLPGVMLWAAPTASGTLTAFGKNFSLESGMQLTLGVITR